MQSAFEWTSAGGVVVAGARCRHVTGGVSVKAEPEGETHIVYTGTGIGTGVERVLDVRGVWLAIELETTALAGVGGVLGGEGVPLSRVWLDMVAAVRLDFQPDAFLPDLSIPVVPDLGDAATLFSVVSGTIAPGVERLRLRSRYRYAPGDARLVALAVASPYLSLDF